MCMTIKKESTHQLIHRNLTLYQREHSAVWQCRYKVDNKWIRATTKETEYELAVNKAKDLLVEAEIRKRSGIPVVTKRFKDIAYLAIDRMERDLRGGLGKVIYKDYIRILLSQLLTGIVVSRLAIRLNELSRIGPAQLLNSLYYL
jgi:hypothetical protein